MLKHLRCCSEFTNDAVIDMRLEHAELRLRQLSLAEWAIHSRQERQRLILQGLYVEGKSWQELQDELHVSQTTISRERNKALALIQNELETWPEFRKSMLESRK
jgi:DNA-directed RNA polymerase specialized sigma subunit